MHSFNSVQYERVKRYNRQERATGQKMKMKS